MNELKELQLYANFLDSNNLWIIAYDGYITPKEMLYSQQINNISMHIIDKWKEMKTINKYDALKLAEDKVEQAMLELEYIKSKI